MRFHSIFISPFFPILHDEGRDGGISNSSGLDSSQGSQTSAKSIQLSSDIQQKGNNYEKIKVSKDSG